jgi:signal transduction histidine kinase
LDTLAKLFPQRAFGVCLVEPGKDEPFVDRRVPPGFPEPRRDPTRLFAEFDDEDVFELAGLQGSTLHVGRARAAGGDASTIGAVTERAAALLSFGVRAAFAIGTARPVSEQVTELRSQLVQAEKLATLGQIVAGVVHELANPITSIVACAEYLERKSIAASAPSDDLEHLRRINRAADRILKFSRDLVAYARPATEIPAPIMLSDVIAQAFTFCEHEFTRHDVEFSTDYSRGIPPVMGQSGPLTQVFINLFTNAAHSMSDHGGRLQVCTRLTAHDRVAIDVTDGGIGIPQDTLDKIFDPFFTTKEKGRGTGLGLSIVREIVRAHRGTVEAASTPGEGSTFTVVLPRYDSGR